MLDLVGVLLSSIVDTLHALTLGGTSDTALGTVDIVVGTVQQTDSDDGRNALEHGHDVAPLVDLAGAHGVVAEETHSPAQRAAALQELLVVAGFGLSYDLAVGELVDLGLDQSVFLLVGGGTGGVGILALVDGALGGGGEILLRAVLHDSIVGHLGDLSTLKRSRALEEEGAVEDHPPLEGVILLDDTGVDVGNEEESGQDEESTTSAQSHTSNPVTGLLAQTQVRRTLVDDRETANGTSDQEPEGSAVDRPGDGVAAHVDNELDEQEDDGSEATRDDGGHSQASEDGTETLALVPAPLHLVSTNGGNADTSNSRNQ